MACAASWRRCWRRGRRPCSLALYQLAAAVAGLPFPAERALLQRRLRHAGRHEHLGNAAAVRPVHRAGGDERLPRRAGRGADRRRPRRPRRRLRVATRPAGPAPRCSSRRSSCSLLSTSSTAYVGLAGLAVARVATHLVWPVLKGEGRPKTMAATLALLAAVAVAYAASDDLRALVQKMVLRQKRVRRRSTSAPGPTPFRPIWSESTLGLGRGFGQQPRVELRAVAAQHGRRAGRVALFAGVIWLLVRPLGGAFAGPQRALAAGLLAVLGMKLLSSPDLATPGMWALMAALVAARAAGEAASQSSAFFAGRAARRRA